MPEWIHIYKVLTRCPVNSKSVHCQIHIVFLYQNKTLSYKIFASLLPRKPRKFWNDEKLVKWDNPLKREVPKKKPHNMIPIIFNLFPTMKISITDFTEALSLALCQEIDKTYANWFSALWWKPWVELRCNWNTFYCWYKTLLTVINKLRDPLIISFTLSYKD